MNKKVIAIIGLNLALPLLFACPFAYALTNGWGNGEVAPSILAVTLTGDKEKFEEDHWIGGDVVGGVSEFSYTNENKYGTFLALDGKAIAGSNDYMCNFDLKKEGVGSLIFDFKQFRKFYDGTGGFSSNFAPTLYSKTTYSEINRDLFMDIGDFKIEGIASKEENTKCALSYAREYRKGTKSLTSWGSVTQGSTTRKILPTFIETDEIVDKFNFKIEHTAQNGVHVSAEQEYEKVRVASEKVNNKTLNLNTGIFSATRYKYEDLNSDIYTTTMRISKELNEKTLFSLSVLDNYVRAKTEEVITDESAATTNENHPLNPVKVYQNMLSILPKISFSPFKDLFMNFGVKWEWINTKGKGSYNRNRANAKVTDEFVDMETKRHENKIGETVGLKYEGIKNVIFYADGELEQQLRNEDESQKSFGPNPNPSNNFSRDQNILSLDYDITSGCKWYFMPKANITAEFKYKHGTRDFSLFSNIRSGDVVTGYRGFLDNFDYFSYKPLVMFNFKPCKWLACNFKYALDSTTYDVRTRVEAGTEKSKYLAHTYSGSATLTPSEPLYFTILYQYKQAGTKTGAVSTSGTTNNVPAYNANFKVLNASCGYSPYKDITLKSSYSISKADNFDDFSGIGLPLGLTNFSQDISVGIEKKIRADCSVEFKYDFMQYGETSNGGIDDYEAHLFYSALKIRF